ncbi:MAG: response regulator [Pseudomonadota bacterium]
MKKMLKGKHVLIVDDEPDVIESLKDILEDCLIDSASDFDSAHELLEKNRYDIAILDIMGVNGYELLEIATQKGIPALMLTANALSPKDLTQSLKLGADAYVPKERISDIDIFLEDVLISREKGEKGRSRWFERLEGFFDKKFGEYWKEKSDPRFWNHYI